MIIVKTTSHRQDFLISRIPGVVGPFWKGSSIFDRVSGQFYVVSSESEKSALRIKGVSVAKTCQISDLGKFWNNDARIEDALKVS